MPIPLATYRLQMHPGFTFDDAGAIADYLAKLGVTHVYASPYLQSASGSTHGYDVTHHGQTNAELGGAEGHARMCARFGECGLGHILDIVPNHMSIAGRGNAWWWDVLENGPASRYAAYFDVDWRPPEEKLRDTVLLPILGDHYGRLLEAGEIKIGRDGGAFIVKYHDHEAPIAPRSLNDLLMRAAVACQSEKLAFFAECFGNLPMSTATDRESVMRRHRDKELLRQLLARLCDEEPAVAEAIDQVVGQINASADQLDALLDRQNYRLAFWRTARQDLDYRRFFDINTLVSLRMEDDQVFQDTHRLILQWLREGVLDGLRIDHPDGLRDPKRYFERLRAAAPNAWLVVEKILQPGESLPEDWPVAGTTGYDFLNRLGGLFVDPAGEEPIGSFYAQFTGQTTDYASMVREKKLAVLENLFGSDINRMTSLLVKVCERQRRYRDYTRPELRAMLCEVIACFGVYRTYAQASDSRVSEHDARYVGEAIEAAKSHRTDIDPDLFAFMQNLLTLKVTGSVEAEFVMRFQQTTGPVMAKGVEDTVFYNFNRLVALNEVGGNPGQFGISLADFHHTSIATQRHWPTSMLATTTHDTKRSQDVRARLVLLSEIPDKWTRAVSDWSTMNQRHKHEDLPDRNAEYLLYQTLVGAWPIEIDRVLAYMHKAAREANAFTSWNDPNPQYERALERFIRGALADDKFVAAINDFVKPLVEPGRINSLAQVLIKLTAPGIGDIYQGNELWDLSLVDPDNRRPVDYAARRRLLEKLDGANSKQVLSGMDEGLPKLWVTTKALHLRRKFSEAFGPEGGYLPLSAQGPRAENVVAYLRGASCVVVCPRLVMQVARCWQGTTIQLPQGVWKNELGDERVFEGEISIETLLSDFPIALLSRGPD